MDVISTGSWSNLAPLGPNGPLNFGAFAVAVVGTTDALWVDVGPDLVKLAEQSAVTWTKGEAFAGVAIVETGNTVYRFRDGVFAGRAKRTTDGADLAWESPPAMARLELVGFLADEGGLWSLSPRWREGAIAVIATSIGAYMLTSRTIDCRIERPLPLAREVPKESSVFRSAAPRHLQVRRPPPPSLTRVQALPAPREH